MTEPGQVPSAEEVARRLASQELVLELYRRLDDGDIEGAAALYADDASFLGAVGPAAIAERMAQGMAPNAGKRTRHLIANLRAESVDGSTVLARYTAAAHTLDGPGPYAPRSILDQEQRHRVTPDGAVTIVEHRIFGFELS